MVRLEAAWWDLGRSTQEALNVARGALKDDPFPTEEQVDQSRCNGCADCLVSMPQV